MWGISSAGRAPALHAGGQRFDPAILHHVAEREETDRSLKEANHSRVMGWFLSDLRESLLFIKNLLSIIVVTMSLIPLFD